MSDIPTDRDAIILEPGLFCAEHISQSDSIFIPLLNGMMATQGRLLESERVFEIAYRLRNGYGPPEGMDLGDVPESERPGVEHINDTIREIQPICCWLVDHAEDPWPDESGPVFVHLLADYAEREMSDPDTGGSGA